MRRLHPFSLPRLTPSEKNFLVLVACFTYLLFFRPHLSIRTNTTDGDCYLSYSFMLAGMPDIGCYSWSMFPGIALAWLPATVAARIVSFVTGLGFVDLAVPFIAFWNYALYIACLPVLFHLFRNVAPVERGAGVLYSRRWFCLLWLISSVTLNSAMIDAVTSAHIGEVLLSLLIVLMLDDEKLGWATFFTLWLGAARPNSLLGVILIVGAVLDRNVRRGKHPLINRKEIAVLGLAALPLTVALVWVGFIKGYHGIFVQDVLKFVSPAMLWRVLMTPYHGMVWFTPVWLFIFGAGCYHARRLSWTSRASLLLMAIMFVVHVGHAGWWGETDQEIRYFIGTFAQALIVLRELWVFHGMKWKIFFQRLLLFNGVFMAAHTWLGFRPPVTVGIIPALLGTGTTVVAHDGSSMSFFSRKLFLEPLGTSPIGISLLSWFKDAAFFAPYQSFARYAFPRWQCTLVIVTLLCPVAIFFFVKSLRFALRERREKRAAGNRILASA